MFKKISIQDFELNPVTTISDEWMLLSAGNAENEYNTMTVSWGHLGAIWGHGKGLPTAIVYVRPQRYTKEFIDKEEVFTLSILENEYKQELAYLGSHSGRDGNKINKAGLTPFFDHNTVYFSEARMVLVCKKLYHAPLIEEGFVDKTLIEQNYPEKDFHEMYIGEIIEIMIKK